MGERSTGTFSFSGRVRSVTNALRGIGLILRTQHNAWIHAAATLVVCTTGAFLGLSPLEWTAIVIAIVAVWTAEALNTAFELLCDVTSPELNPLVAKAKDVAAGAVLVSAAGAVVIGLLILGPHLV